MMVLITAFAHTSNRAIHAQAAAGIPDTDTSELAPQSKQVEFLAQHGSDPRRQHQQFNEQHRAVVLPQVPHTHKVGQEASTSDFKAIAIALSELNS